MISIVRPDYLPASGTYEMRTISQVNDFVVHHSAGPQDQTPLQIDAFERTRGDIFMPYTWLIDNSGVIYSGRPWLAVSAASYGRNKESVACCLIGNFQEDDHGYNGPVSQKMWDALYELRVYAQTILPYLCRTYGHGQIANLFYGGDSEYATACPGSDVVALLPQFKVRVGQALAHG